MNNTLNDISFRQHVRGYYGDGASFPERRTRTMLDILVSQGKQSHTSYSIHSMNSHLYSMHVSNSAVVFGISKLWQLYWESWQIYKSVNTHFQSLGVFCCCCYSFFISWIPYFQQVHRVSSSHAKGNVLYSGSALLSTANSADFLLSLRNYIVLLLIIFDIF